jgi:hypothetical protein
MKKRYSQLSLERFEILKLPRDHKPVFDVLLDSHQRIVGIATHIVRDYAKRKTVDHVVDLWVETLLHDPEGSAA